MVKRSSSSHAPPSASPEAAPKPAAKPRTGAKKRRTRSKNEEGNHTRSAEAQLRREENDVLRSVRTALNHSVGIPDPSLPTNLPAAVHYLREVDSLHPSGETAETSPRIAGDTQPDPVSQVKSLVPEGGTDSENDEWNQWINESYDACAFAAPGGSSSSSSGAVAKPWRDRWDFEPPASDEWD